MTEHFINISHSIKNEKGLEQGTPVKLIKELPTGFGNRKAVPVSAKGFLTSTGFVAGYISATFSIPGGGTAHVKFNQEEAEEYLSVKK